MDRHAQVCPHGGQCRRSRARLNGKRMPALSQGAVIQNCAAAGSTGDGS
jgi:hypothetical protein